MSFRIATSTIFSSGTSRISDLTSDLSKIQQQLSTGKRIVSPSDDPLGAGRALDLSAGQGQNTQLTTNRTSARNALQEEETSLTSVTSLLQDIRDNAIAAGSGALDDASRRDIATSLQNQLEQLVSLANSQGSTGNYLFAGYRDRSQPFTGSGGATQYVGDTGDKALQVSTNRQIAVGDSGDALFMNIPATGVNTTSASGGATVSSLAVVDAAKLTGHNYEIVFSGGNYSVFDATLDPAHAGTPLVNAAYAAGQPITFDGLQLTPTGTPANGDSITVKPQPTQSIFKTVSDLIGALQTGKSVASGATPMEQNLSLATSNIDHALDNVLTARASVGSRMKELDNLDDFGSARDLNYSQELSAVQDVDYVKAISEFTQKQTTLQASQQSFVKVTGLSLFNYL
ncbi:flagellar hook-associated protein FlgL [Noviherbaspirillum pedocola]|uniref:Flagellar hook-associated protein FlgL n=1 Tax=Noviherbaspirillum pedocola TaxID=2801341 RepID=A0A934SWG6_9BURK|nr:flagellar hook-associated protein FlgL [Noviherbaspirillum pedocola]MBK4737032.1 flagellar hook-associated protein FlgL [Noviherbaspirillum pedocola]